MPIAGQVGSQSIKYWPTVTQLQTPDTSVMCDCERPVAQRLWHVSGLVLLTGPHVVTDSGLVTSDKLETCAGSPVAQFEFPGPGPAVRGGVGLLPVYVCRTVLSRTARGRSGWGLARHSIASVVHGGPSTLTHSHARSAPPCSTSERPRARRLY